MIKGPLRKFGKNSVVDPSAIREIIDGVRSRGYAYGESDLEDGVASISAPIRDHRGNVIAAIGLAGFSVMFDGHEKSFAENLLRAAGEISANSVAGKANVPTRLFSVDVHQELEEGGRLNP